MGKRLLWSVTSLFVVATLLLVSCGPRAVPAPTTAPAPSAPTPVTPAATPAPTTPAAAQGDMISVTLKKLDGTAVKKQLEKPKYGGILNLRSTSDPIWSLKTVTGGGSSVLDEEKLLLGDWARGPAGTGEFSWQIYEYFKMDEFMGALAEKWEMPDDQTIIFHIRRGVHWALDDREASKLVGGREVSADDVVFSLKWWFFSEPKAVLGRTFGGTKNADISATDKYTVVVKAPKQDLNQLLGYVSDYLPIIPPEVIQKYGDFTNWDKVVGTGAFTIKDFVSGSMTTWRKNPSYWGYDPVLGKDYPLPYVDSIKFFNIVDESTAAASFRTGKLDGTLTLTKEMWASTLKTAPWAKTKIINFGTGSNHLAMQMNDAKAPWQDIRVRRALMLAINHQEIVDTYYGGSADLQAFPLPGAPELYAMGWSVPLKELPSETQELFGYDPDKAKKLLTEAGYPNGFKTSLMLSASSAETLDVAALIKAYWAKVGVDLTLDIRDAAVVTGYQNRMDYPAMFYDSRWGAMAQYIAFEPPPTQRNAGNIMDSHLQELRLKMFDVSWDPKKRTPIMKELYQYTLSQVWYLPLPSKWNYRIYQPWVKNYDAETSIGNFGQAWPFIWLDLDLKRKLGF